MSSTKIELVMKINKVCTKVANYINKSTKAQKFLTNIADNPANFSNKFNCGVNGFLRPIASIAVATDKMDGIYGSSSSVCSSNQPLEPLYYI